MASPFRCALISLSNVFYVVDSFVLAYFDVRCGVVPDAVDIGSQESFCLGAYQLSQGFGVDWFHCSRVDIERYMDQTVFFYYPYHVRDVDSGEDNLRSFFEFFYLEVEVKSSSNTESRQGVVLGVFSKKLMNLKRKELRIKADLTFSTIGSLGVVSGIEIALF